MNERTAVAALQEVRRVVELWGPAIRFRKLYGVLNAIEMQIEDGAFRAEAVLRLGEALQETAVFYGVDSAAQNRLAQAFVGFLRKLVED